VRSSLFVLPWVLLTIPASAAPALEAEVRAAGTYQPIAENTFRTRTGEVRGASYGVPQVWLTGGELSVFGRGETFAFGPMFGISTTSARTNSGSSTDSVFTQVRYGAESRASFAHDRFSGWVGFVFGATTTAISVPPNDACSLCPKGGRRTDWLLQPRLGAEYAIVSNPFGRIAIGAWLGVEPLQGAWHTGVLFSARLPLMSGPAGTPMQMRVRTSEPPG